MRSDTHQRANQIDRIGASAKIPCPLLSGVGTISRNTPHLREQKSSCVTVDWRSGQPARLPTSFCNFFFLEKKKLTVSPWQRDLALLRRRKSHRFSLSKEFSNPFVEKRSKINKNLSFISLTVQKKSEPHSPRASPVGAHTARRREHA